MARTEENNSLEGFAKKVVTSPGFAFLAGVAAVYDSGVGQLLVNGHAVPYHQHFTLFSPPLEELIGLTLASYGALAGSKRYKEIGGSTGKFLAAASAGAAGVALDTGKFFFPFGKDPHWTDFPHIFGDIIPGHYNQVNVELIALGVLFCTFVLPGYSGKKRH